MSDSDHASEPALERFVFFSDAVFAIAITLLAIEIKVPELSPKATDAEWTQALLRLAPNFFDFGLSFFVIGSIWAAHHGVFRLVGRFDQRLMAPNLLLLLAVVLVPFATGMIGGTILASVPYAFYSATLLLAGLSKARLTAVALRPGMTRPDIPRETIVATLRRSWLMPVASALAIALAFVAPAWNNLAMLILLAARLPMFRGPR